MQSSSGRVPFGRIVQWPGDLEYPWWETGDKGRMEQSSRPSSAEQLYSVGDSFENVPPKEESDSFRYNPISPRKNAE